MSDTFDLFISKTTGGTKKDKLHSASFEFDKFTTQFNMLRPTFTNLSCRLATLCLR